MCCDLIFSFQEFHFVPYTSSDYQSEKQLALQKTDFAKQAEGAVVDLIADEEDGLRKQNNVRRWLVICIFIQNNMMKFSIKYFRICKKNFLDF